MACDAEDRLTDFDRENEETQSWSLSLVDGWSSTTGAYFTTSTSGFPPSFSETRTHNAVHEIESIDRNGPVALSHDAKGNLTLDEDGNTYTWDFDNRLQQVRSANGGLVASFTYDAFGRRTTKTVPGNFPGDPSVTTLFVCLTDNSGMGQQLSEYESGVMVRLYTYGTYIDEPLSMTRLDVNVPAAQQTRRERAVDRL